LNREAPTHVIDASRATSARRPAARLRLPLEATFTDIAVIGMVAEGLRIDAHYNGNVVVGPLAGGIVRGVD
jgi:hypothetical protein